MVSFMGSLVYDWLLNAGDEKLAKKFKKEANPEPLPPNSPRLADIVKHYKETTPQKRKAEPVVNGSAKKAKKVRDLRFLIELENISLSMVLSLKILVSAWCIASVGINMQIQAHFTQCQFGVPFDQPY